MNSNNDARVNAKAEMVFAGFWIRLMAHNVDLIILLPLFYVLSVFIPQNAIFYPSCGCLILLYEVGFIGSNWEATPGKRMVKIKVRSDRNQPIGWLRSLARTVMKVLSVATFFIGYGFIAFHPKKKGLHDLIVHSVVIFEPTP